MTNVLTGARTWCLTINNYTAKDVHCFELIKPISKYWIYGLEMSKDLKTPHLQCYILFNKDVTFYEVKGFFRRAHIEIARKDSNTNIAYCKKENNFVEFGSIDFKQ
nr:MAG: replication associated protein [Cressdnaviricota sp.]